jgi:hypothetical protein
MDYNIHNIRLHCQPQVKIIHVHSSKFQKCLLGSYFHSTSYWRTLDLVCEHDKKHTLSSQCQQRRIQVKNISVFLSCLHTRLETNRIWSHYLNYIVFYWEEKIKQTLESINVKLFFTEKVINISAKSLESAWLKLSKFWRSLPAVHIWQMSYC